MLALIFKLVWLLIVVAYHIGKALLVVVLFCFVALIALLMGIKISLYL